MDVDEPVDQNAQIQELLNQIIDFLITINDIWEQFGRLKDMAEEVRFSGLARIDLNGPEVQFFIIPHPNDLNLIFLRIVRIEHAQNADWGEHYILHFGVEFPAPILMRMIIKREGPPGQPLQDQPWVIMRYSRTRVAGQINVTVPCKEMNGTRAIVPPDMVFYAVNRRQADLIQRFFRIQNGAAQIPIIANRLQNARNRLNQMLATLNTLEAVDDPLWEQAMQANQQLMTQFMQSIQTMNQIEQRLNELVNRMNHIRDQLPTAVSTAYTHFFD